MTNGVISNFQPKTAFHAVDYNDKSEISGWGMPSNRYIDLAIGASGAIYDTLANGWFCLVFYHPDNTTYAGYGVDVLDSSENFLYNIQGERNLKGQYEGVIMPIKSGHKLQVHYNDCTVYRFRFIYAEGER